MTRKKNQSSPIVSIKDLQALEAIENQVDFDDARKTLADTSKKGLFPGNLLNVNWICGIKDGVQAIFQHSPQSTSIIQKFGALQTDRQLLQRSKIELPAWE